MSTRHSKAPRSTGRSTRIGELAIGRSVHRRFERLLRHPGARALNSSFNPPIDHPITRSPDHPIVGSPDHPIDGSPDHPIQQRDSGFTMIELLVGMTQYKSSQVFAKEAVLKEDLFRMRDAIDQYYADKNQYPSTLDALVSDGYMRAVPEDPFTKSNTTWQSIPAEPDPNNPTAEPGVYDVKSGSDATAIDG